MSHSQFKKYNILQELQQAIKKKTQQKYRTKSKPKFQQTGIRQEVKHPKSPQIQKNPVSKTAQINKIPKSSDFKVKKHHNKKFDKLVSLINYTITSADKALKYVNLSTNFEAEFTYKLYHSDRENLMNELNSININDFLPISPSLQFQNKSTNLANPNNANSNLNIETAGLKGQIERLKKQNMILEGQVKKHRMHEFEQRSPRKKDQQAQILKRHIDAKQNELRRVSGVLKKVCIFEQIYEYLDNIQKQGKLRALLSSLQGKTNGRTQRQDVQYSIIELQKRITVLQQQIIAKSVSSQNKNEQVQDTAIQVEKIRQMINRKILPVLSQATTEQIAFDSYSDIITMYIGIVNKKQKELIQTKERLQKQILQIQNNQGSRKVSSQIQQQGPHNQNSKIIMDLKKQNELMKINLTQIYDQIKDILESGNAIGPGDHTYEQLIKAIAELMETNRILSKKSQLSIKHPREQRNSSNEQVQKLKINIKAIQEQSKRFKSQNLKLSQQRAKIDQFLNNLQKKNQILNDEVKQYQQNSRNVQTTEKLLEQRTSELQENIVLNRQLQNQLKKTKAKIAKFETEEKKMQEIIYRDKEENQRQAQIIQQYKQKLTEAHNRLSQQSETEKYVEAIQALQSENEEIKSIFEELERELSQQRKQVQQKQRQILQLRNLIEDYQTNEKNISTQLQRIMRQSHRLQEQLNLEKKELTKKDSRIEQLSKQIHILNTSNARLLQQVNRDQNSEQIEKLSYELHSIKIIVQQKEKELKNAIISHQKQASRLVGIIEQKQIYLKNLQKTVEEMNIQLQRMEKELNKVESKVQMDPMELDLKLNQRQLEVQQRYQLLLKNKDEDILEIENKMSVYQEKIQSLRQQLCSKDQQIQAHKGMVNFMESKEIQLNQKIEEYQTLGYQLEQTKERCTQLDEQIQKGNQIIADLKEQIQQKDKDLSLKQQRIREISSESEQLKHRLNTSESVLKQVNDLKNLVEQKEYEIKKTKQQNQQLIIQIERLSQKQQNDIKLQNGQPSQQQLSEISNKLFEKSEQNDRLNKQIQEINRICDELQTVNTTYKEQNDYLQSQIQADAQKQVNENKELKQSLQQLNNLLQQKTLELQSKNQQFELLSHEKDFQAQQLQRINHWLTQKDAQIAYIQNEKKENIKKIQQINTTLKQKEKMAESMQDNIRRANQTIQQYQQKVQEQNILESKMIEQKIEQIQTLENKCKQLQREMGNKQKECQNLFKQIQDTKTDSAQELQKLESIIQATKDSLLEKETTVNNLREQINIKLKQIESLVTQKNENLRRIQQMQQEITQIKKISQERISVLEKQIQSWKQAHISVQQAENGRNSEIINLNNIILQKCEEIEIEKASAKCQQIEARLHKTVEDNRQSQKSIELQNNILKQTLEHLKDQIDKLKINKQTQWKQMQQQRRVLKQKDDQLNRLNKSLKNIVVKVKQQKQRQMAAKQQQNNLIDNLLEQKQRQIRSLYTMLEQKDQQIIQITIGKQKIQQHTQSLQSKFEMLRNQFAQKYESYIHKDQLSKVMQTLNQIMAEKISLHSKIESLEKQKEQLKQKLKQTEYQNENTSEEVLKSLSNQINALELENCDLKMDLQSQTHKSQLLQQKLIEKNNRIFELQYAIKQLNERGKKVIAIASSSKLSNKINSAQQIQLEQNYAVNESDNQAAAELLQQINQLQLVIDEFQKKNDDSQESHGYVIQVNQVSNSNNTAKQNSQLLKQATQIQYKQQNIEYEEWYAQYNQSKGCYQIFQDKSELNRHQWYAQFNKQTNTYQINELQQLSNENIVQKTKQLQEFNQPQILINDSEVLQQKQEEKIIICDKDQEIANLTNQKKSENQVQIDQNTESMIRKQVEQQISKVMHEVLQNQMQFLNRQEPLQTTNSMIRKQVQAQMHSIANQALQQIEVQLAIDQVIILNQIQVQNTANNQQSEVVHQQVQDQINQISEQGTEKNNELFVEEELENKQKLQTTQSFIRKQVQTQINRFQEIILGQQNEEMERQTTNSFIRNEVQYEINNLNEDVIKSIDKQTNSEVEAFAKLQIQNIAKKLINQEVAKEESEIQIIINRAAHQKLNKVITHVSQSVSSILNHVQIEQQAQLVQAQNPCRQSDQPIVQNQQKVEIENEFQHQWHACYDRDLSQYVIQQLKFKQAVQTRLTEAIQKVAASYNVQASAQKIDASIQKDVTPQKINNFSEQPIKTDSIIRRQVEAQIEQITNQILGNDLNQTDSLLKKEQPEYKKIERNDIQQFVDYRDESMNDSMVSQKQDKSLEKSYENNEDLVQKLLQDNNDKYEGLNQENENGNDFQNFNDMEQNQNLGQSMISNQSEKQQMKSEKQIEKEYEEDQKQQNDIQDFANYREQQLGKSMISNQSQEKEETPDCTLQIKTPNQAQKRDKISIGNQGNEFEEFLNIKNEQLGKSMISNESNNNSSEGDNKDQKVETFGDFDYKADDSKVQNTSNKHEQEVQNNQSNDLKDCAEQDQYKGLSEEFGCDNKKDKKKDTLIELNHNAQDDRNKDTFGEFGLQINKEDKNKATFGDFQSQVFENNKQTFGNFSFKDSASQLQQKAGNNYNFENQFDGFADFEQNKASDSMLSHHSNHQMKDEQTLKRQILDEIQAVTGQLKQSQLQQQNEDNNFDDFAEMKDEMGNSMFSNKSASEIQAEVQALDKKIEDQLDAEIQKAKKQINQLKTDQKLFQKTEQNLEQKNDCDFDQFGSISQNKIGDSICSNNHQNVKNSRQQNDFNIADFNQPSQGGIGDSILSKNEFNEQNRNNQKTINRSNELQDFLDYGSEKMSESQASIKDPFEQTGELVRQNIIQAVYTTKDFADIMQPQMSESTFPELVKPQTQELFSEFERQNIKSQLQAINQKLRTSNQSATQDLPQLLGMLSGNDLSAPGSARQVASFEFDFGEFERQSELDMRNLSEKELDYGKNLKSRQQKQFDDSPFKE